MKKILIILGSVGLLMPTTSTVVACSSPNSAEKSTPSIWGLKDQTIKVGETTKVLINIYNEIDGKIPSVLLVNPSIGEVNLSEDGTWLSIHGIEVGETSIIVSYPGATNQAFKLTVTEEDATPSIEQISNKKMTVEDPNLSVDVVVNNPIEGRFVKAVSSNSNVASVSKKSGSNTLLIDALSVGTTTITVSYPDPAIVGVTVESITFTVEVVAMTPIISQPSDMTIETKSYNNNYPYVDVNVQYSSPGVYITATSEDKDIITVTTSQNRITIKPAISVPDYTTSRSATITVGYPNADPVTFTVKLIAAYPAFAGIPNEQKSIVFSENATQTIDLTIYYTVSGGKIIATSSDENVVKVESVSGISNNKAKLVLKITATENPPENAPLTSRINLTYDNDYKVSTTNFDFTVKHSSLIN